MFWPATPSVVHFSPPLIRESILKVLDLLRSSQISMVLSPSHQSDVHTARRTPARQKEVQVITE